MTGPAAPELPVVGDRQTIRRQVGHALRAALITGELRPGVLYSAPSLAARFGVSATPVREAMLDLVKEGLVEVAPNKGFRVTELSERDLDDITEIRALIEIPTVAEIARRHDPEHAPALGELRETAAGIVEFARTGALTDYIELDRQFHLGLLALAGNPHLVTVVGELRARSRLYGLAQLQEHGVLTRSAAEHLEIVDRVLAGDADGARELMQRHLSHVRGSWATGTPTD